MDKKDLDINVEENVTTDSSENDEVTETEAEATVTEEPSEIELETVEIEDPTEAVVLEEVELESVDTEEDDLAEEPVKSDEAVVEDEPQTEVEETAAVSQMDVAVEEIVVTEDALLEEESAVTLENPDEVVVDEKEDVAKDEIISEFAPEPIKIPNYNKEKERRKAKKAHEKNKKMRSKKARRRRRILRKVLVVMRTTLLSLLLIIVATATVASLIVKMNTSEYSIKKAVRKSKPETFTVGKIENPEELRLVASSPHASVIDILRDNATDAVTYEGIANQVDASTYPEYVAEITHGIIEYYLYGKPVERINKEDINGLLRENKECIYSATGRALTDMECQPIAERIAASAAVQEISPVSLAKQPAVKYTKYTVKFLETKVLLALVVSLLVLFILAVIYCRGYWHRVIGFAIMLGGIVSGLAGTIYKPAFNAKSPFVKCVLEGVTKEFNHNALIYAGIAVLVGFLVLLVGKTITDNDYYYEDEDSAEE